ncbi:MAG: hypothetical protein JXB10_09105 [Pirellulales bacterium]|nr:hypothetical protein [Pirellulales bacterium]
MTTALQPQSDMEVSQATAIANLPPDVMMMKMENESIMAVARATPRDPMKIVGQLQQLIDAYPAAADEAIYSKPVGTVMEITCQCGIKYEVNIKWVQRKPVAEQEPCPECGEWKPKEQKAVKKYAEGLSARAAESIRSIFGYTRLATTTEILEDGKARITGVLVDYAAGNITSDERIVSPYYRARSGQMQRVAEDRFLNLTVKAEISKLRRDVILLSTPNIVKACFKDACENKIRGLISDEVIEQKIIPAFAAAGITPAQLDLIVGRPHALGWKEDERLKCRKILSALKNEETTVRELLDGLDVEGKTPPPKQGGATMDDLTQPTTQSLATQAPASKATATDAGGTSRDEESLLQDYQVSIESEAVDGKLTAEQIAKYEEGIKTEAKISDACRAKLCSLLDPYRPRGQRRQAGKLFEKAPRPG